MEQTLASTVLAPALQREATPLRGVPLLDLVLLQIELNPDSWDQGEWRCKTGMCVAGWAATLAGGRWRDKDPDDPYLLAEVDDDKTCVISEESFDAGKASHQVVSASSRAERLLGLSYANADDLFSPGNTLEYLRECREALAAGKDTPRVARYCGEKSDVAVPHRPF